MSAAVRMEMNNISLDKSYAPFVSGLGLPNNTKNQFCSLGGVIDETSILVNYMPHKLLTANKSAMNVLKELSSDYPDITELKHHLAQMPECIIVDTKGDRFTLSLKPKLMESQYNSENGDFSEDFFLEYGWLKCKHDNNLRSCWSLTPILH